MYVCMYVTTAEMIRKLKARFVRKPRRSGRKIDRELNILRERMQHILKNEPKIARAQRWKKKLDWEKPRSYFGCTKVAEFGFRFFGRSPLVFIDRRVKINAEYYRENVLKTVLKP